MLPKLVILSSLALMIGCTSLDHSTEAITEKEVEDFIAMYDNAWNTKDSLAVGELLADDYLYFTSTGEVNKKMATMNFLSDPNYVIHKTSRAETEITIRANVATVSSRWIGELSWKGEAIHDNQRCGFTIAKIDGLIQLLSEHCVEIKK
jgi:hypothetical protein